jgi:hypothetical protein
MTADEELHELAVILRPKRAFVYGSAESAIAYTYDSTTSVLEVEFGVTEGRVVGRAK